MGRVEMGWDGTERDGMGWTGLSHSNAWLGAASTYIKINILLVRNSNSFLHNLTYTQFRIGSVVMFR
jgi:hypothetical protein